MANVSRLPTVTGVREYVEAGSLMSYGANLTDLFRRAGDFVDKILRGAKPGDIPRRLRHVSQEAGRKESGPQKQYALAPDRFAKFWRD